MYGMRPTNAAGELRRYAVPARKIGVSAEEYQKRIEAGDKWCSYSKHWAERGMFGSTGMGRVDSYCLECRQLFNVERRTRTRTMATLRTA
jgi:IS1 family transposase